MGILNITTDSFYSESRYPVLEKAIKAALLLEAHGADILDIGGESTRPGALPVSEEEELQRVIPVIQFLKGTIAIPISIDTIKPTVAAAAIKAGAALINDVSGFDNPDMIAVALENPVDICVVHMQGTPQTMQLNPHYAAGIIPDLLEWFERKSERLLKSGIQPDRIILDPGIGFGKTVAHNLEIIQNLPKLKRLGFRVLLGISRKSFLSKILNKTPSELLSGTLALNSLAIASDVDIIRVHDVKEHRDAVDAIRICLQN
ncbi:MAG: dihydropteroate synthase [Micropruina sp.]|uniref:dihydropteroate synthase n=1 Tax=Micropruina sp. TaxID=2737536 RepID=UPI0039E26E37